MNKLSFEVWKQHINAWLFRKYGLTSDLLPDIDYWTLWDSGSTSIEAAKQAVANAKEC